MQNILKKNYFEDSSNVKDIDKKEFSVLLKMYCSKICFYLRFRKSYLVFIRNCSLAITILYF